MKRLTAVLLIMILIMTFLTACGSKDRILYKDVDLEDYVTVVDDYLGVTVDTKSTKYKECYKEVFNSDIGEFELYKSTKEVVELDDTVIIDYVGKIDGVAFGGGTANGASLKIGSKTYIDDFEDELIGLKPGDTKDVTAKFPDDYQTTDLAGKEAVFTVKLRYINVAALTEAEAYSKMNFKTLSEYQKDLKERAIKKYLLDDVISKTTIRDYPREEVTIIGDAIVNTYLEAYDLSLDELSQLLYKRGYTIDTFKQSCSQEMMNTNMAMYYIYDELELEMLYDTKGNEGIEQPAIVENNNIQYTVIEYLYKNAKIK